MFILDKYFHHNEGRVPTRAVIIGNWIFWLLGMLIDLWITSLKHCSTYNRSKDHACFGLLTCCLMRQHQLCFWELTYWLRNSTDVPQGPIFLQCLDNSIHHDRQQHTLVLQVWLHLKNKNCMRAHLGIRHIMGIVSLCKQLTAQKFRFVS